MAFATQNDGKKAPKYWVMKNGIATPSMMSPPSFAIAIPSTLFDEKDTMSSEIMTPIEAVNADKTIFSSIPISVSEKKSSIMIENTADIAAGKPSLDSK